MAEVHYFVDFKLHNKVNNGWAYKTTKNTTSLDEAKKDYHSQLSTYIGGDTFDLVSVVLSDMFGNVITSEYWVAPIAPATEE